MVFLINKMATVYRVFVLPGSVWARDTFLLPPLFHRLDFLSSSFSVTEHNFLLCLPSLIFSHNTDRSSPLTHYPHCRNDHLSFMFQCTQIHTTELNQSSLLLPCFTPPLLSLSRRCLGPLLVHPSPHPPLIYVATLSVLFICQPPLYLS